MDHRDHVFLLRNGVPPGGVWAELGSGDGAFTLALAELLGDEGAIYSVDRDRRALQRQELLVRRRFPAITLHIIAADFEEALDFLPPLHGLLLANSLHFVRHKAPLLTRLRARLRDEGRLLLVEYDTDRGNRWVPHPLSFATWQALADQAGFSYTELLATRPSSFLGRFYAAASYASASNNG